MWPGCGAPLGAPQMQTFGQRVGMGASPFLPRVIQNTGRCKGRVRGWGGAWTPTELTRSSSPGGRWMIGGLAGLSVGSHSRGSSPVQKEPPSRIAPVPGVARRPALASEPRM